MSPFVPPLPKHHKKRLSLLAGALFARRDVMARYRAPGLHLVVVNEPKLARSILIEQWERFPKSSLLCRMLHPAIGGGVLVRSRNGIKLRLQRRSPS